MMYLLNQAFLVIIKGFGTRCVTSWNKMCTTLQSNCKLLEQYLPEFDMVFVIYIRLIYWFSQTRPQSNTVNSILNTCCKFWDFRLEFWRLRIKLVQTIGVIKRNFWSPICWSVEYRWWPVWQITNCDAQNL